MSEDKMQVFHGIEEFEKAVGTHLGYSDWHTVTQEQVNLFAEATGDHQWIHVDPERAAQGPFGTTIAHGYLTLSLVPAANGAQATARVTIELEGSDKPACVAETVSVLVP